MPQTRKSKEETPVKHPAFRHLLKFGAALFLLAAFLISPALPGAEAVIYVTEQGGTGNNGLSWTSAYNAETFATRLKNADAGEEFWVAKGTYRAIYPDNPNPKESSNSFVLNKGVKVYGGFFGNETALSQRDWKTNKTILTGELTEGTTYSYHVVDASNINKTNNTAVLNGFTITKGRADGNTLKDKYGGGLYSFNGNIEIWNCTFTDNHAIYAGGALAHETGNITLAYCTFTDNSSTSYGGAGVLVNASDPVIVGCAFSENKSDTGGGLYNAGLYEAVTSKPKLTNCTFYANEAINGGALYNSGNSNSVITNCTFSRNSATSEGSGMYSFASDPIIMNSIFWNTGTSEIYNAVSPVIADVTISDSVVNGGFGGGIRIITADPKLAALADNGGPTLTCAIASDSSAVDKGQPKNTVVSGTVVVPDIDQRGVTRPQGSGVDIGAYEYVPSSDGGGGGGCQSTTPVGAAWLMIPMALLLLRRRN